MEQNILKVIKIIKYGADLFIYVTMLYSFQKT